MTNILVLLGSLRAASLNRQIADLAVELGATEGLGVAVYDGLGRGAAGADRRRGHDLHRR